jgi:glycine betaine/proline transport system permease protein
VSPTSAYHELLNLLSTKIPLGDWIEQFIDFFTANFAWLLNAISRIILIIANNLAEMLTALPALLFIVLIGCLMGYVRNWKYGLITGLAFLLMFNLGLWEETMLTLALVLTSAFLALVVGIPVGILAAHNRFVYMFVRPVLDFMQTIPPFVYLIPAMMFFGLGRVPAVVATFIFASPPAVRLTYLGFREVPQELLEAGHAFGANWWQMLFKIELPAAMSSLKMGVNQTIMMSLSMIVVAAMIGAKGLGQTVLRSLSWIDPGLGFEAGLGIVIIAIVVDRLVTE